MSPRAGDAMAEANNIGDTKVMWDPNDRRLGRRGSKAAFDEATRGKKRMVAYDVDDTGQKTGGIVQDVRPRPLVG
jgi:hypothetical protein